MDVPAGRPGCARIRTRSRWASSRIDYTHTRRARRSRWRTWRAIDQRLDLWRGVLTSAYTIDGEPVSVTTAADPDRDTLAVRIESPLFARGLAVRLALPRGYDTATSRIRRWTGRSRRRTRRRS